jgi:hypothetical protein
MRRVGRIFAADSVAALIAILSVSSATHAADADATAAQPDVLAEPEAVRVESFGSHRI